MQLRFISKHLLYGLSFMVPAVPLYAATRIWDGTPSNDFTNGSNWGGTAPVDNTISDIAQFSASPAPANQPVLNSNRSVNGLAFSSSANYTLSGTGLLTVGSSDIVVSGSGNTSISLSLAGGGSTSVNKSGGGILTLSGSNNYDGGTTVSGGTLLFNGNSSASSGAATVASGATLGGTGSYGGSVNVSGVLSPGASIESFSTGAVSFLAGSTLKNEINSNNLTSDLLSISGNLNINSTAMLNLTDLGSLARAVGDKLTLIEYSGSWNGTGFSGYADDSTFTLGANVWKINYNDTAGANFYGGGGYYHHDCQSFVTLTAQENLGIPEPSTAFLLGSVGWLVLMRRRR